MTHHITHKTADALQKTPSSSITQQPNGSTLIEKGEDNVFLTHDGGVHFTHELDEIIEFYEKHIRTIVAKLAERNPGNGGDPLLSADAMNQLFAHHKREQAKGIYLPCGR